MLDDSGESTWIDCQVTSDSLTAMISFEREDEDRSMNFSDRSLRCQSHSRHRIVLVMRSLIVLFRVRFIELPRRLNLLMISATLILSSASSPASEIAGNSSAARDAETNEVLVDRWHGFWLGQSIAN